MSAPRVTILVPTIGRVEFLPATRASIEAQTFGDYEVLVLDNASPPEAQAILADWARADARVRVLRCDPRVPMFSNFRRGVAAVKSDYFTFCHDDDVLAPRFVERSLEMLEREKGIAFSGSNYDFIDTRGALLEARREIARTEVWSDARYIRALVARGRNPVTMQSVFYRTSAFGAQGFDDTIPLHFGDFVILMRLAERRGVGLLEDALVQVRQHPAQASNAMPLSRAVPLRSKLMSDYFAEYLARHPEDGRFVEELRRLDARAHRRALVWGWMAAKDDAEARACLDALGGSAIDGAVRTMLRGGERLGLRAQGQKANLARVVRRVAGSLGM